MTASASGRAFRKVGTSAIVALAAAAGLGVLGSSRARASDDDPWLGRDKLLHASVSAGIGGAAYALSVPWIETRPARAAIGFAASFSVGIAKELYDLTGAGTPSGRDLAWDAVGALSGVGVAALIDFAVCRLRRDRTPDDLSVRGVALRW